MVTKKPDDAVAAASAKKGKNAAGDDKDDKHGDGVVGDGKSSTTKNGKDKKNEVELSEEDAALKENLELMVMRASDPKAGVAKLALETMRREIRTATRCASARATRSHERLRRDRGSRDD